MMNNVHPPKGGPYTMSRLARLSLTDTYPSCKRTDLRSSESYLDHEFTDEESDEAMPGESPGRKRKSATNGRDPKPHLQVFETSPDSSAVNMSEVSLLSQTLSHEEKFEGRRSSVTCKRVKQTTDGESVSNEGRQARVPEARLLKPLGIISFPTSPPELSPSESGEQQVPDTSFSKSKSITMAKSKPILRGQRMPVNRLRNPRTSSDHDTRPGTAGVLAQFQSSSGRRGSASGTAEISAAKRRRLSEATESCRSSTFGTTRNIDGQSLQTSKTSESRWSTQGSNDRKESIQTFSQVSEYRSTASHTANKPKRFKKNPQQGGQTKTPESSRGSRAKLHLSMINKSETRQGGALDDDDIEEMTEKPAGYKGTSFDARGTKSSKMLVAQNSLLVNESSAHVSNSGGEVASSADSQLLVAKQGLEEEDEDSLDDLAKDQPPAVISMGYMRPPTARRFSSSLSSTGNIESSFPKTVKVEDKATNGKAVATKPPSFPITDVACDLGHHKFRSSGRIKWENDTDAFIISEGGNNLSQDHFLSKIPISKFDHVEWSSSSEQILIQCLKDSQPQVSWICLVFNHANIVKGFRNALIQTCRHVPQPYFSKNILEKRIARQMSTIREIPDDIKRVLLQCGNDEVADNMPRVEIQTDYPPNIARRDQSSKPAGDGDHEKRISVEIDEDGDELGSLEVSRPIQKQSEPINQKRQEESSRPGPRRRTRNSNPDGDLVQIAETTTSHIPEVDGWSKRTSTWREDWGNELTELTWPPAGKNRVNVAMSDIERLDEGEWLNDNIITFYLRYLEEEYVKSLDGRPKKVFFFTSFFFATLSRERGETGINWKSLKRWAKEDIFKYDFLVVPICANVHWYVAIIAHPGRLLETDAEEDGDEDEPTVLEPFFPELYEDGSLTTKTEKRTSRQLRSTEAVHRTAHATSSPKTMHEPFSPTIAGRVENMSLESDDDFPDEPEIIPSARLESPRTGIYTGTPKRVTRKSTGSISQNRLEDTKVITFDSFGSTHAVVSKDLRIYLSLVAKESHGIIIPSGSLNHTARRIPHQPNQSDCGLYLLGYVQKFLQNPHEFIGKILHTPKEIDWTMPFVENLRAEIRDVILNLRKEQNAKEAESNKGRTNSKQIASAARAKGKSPSLAENTGSSITLEVSTSENRPSRSQDSHPALKGSRESDSSGTSVITRSKKPDTQFAKHIDGKTSYKSEQSSLPRRQQGSPLVHERSSEEIQHPEYHNGKSESLQSTILQQPYHGMDGADDQSEDDIDMIPTISGHASPAIIIPPRRKEDSLEIPDSDPEPEQDVVLIGNRRAPHDAVKSSSTHSDISLSPTPPRVSTSLGKKEVSPIPEGKKSPEAEVVIVSRAERVLSGTWRGKKEKKSKEVFKID